MRACFVFVLVFWATAALGQAAPNPCTDPAGAARNIKRANPGIDDATLYAALMKGQEMYGCRQVAQPPPAYPQTTRCAWEGFGISRAWVCRAE